MENVKVYETPHGIIRYRWPMQTGLYLGEMDGDIIPLNKPSLTGSIYPVGIVLKALASIGSKIESGSLFGKYCTESQDFLNFSLTEAAIQAGHLKVIGNSLVGTLRVIDCKAGAAIHEMLIKDIPLMPALNCEALFSKNKEVVQLTLKYIHLIKV